MDQGEIVLDCRLGEQGGYGVIKGAGGMEYIFTLEDVVNYFGGDMASAGLRVGYQVLYTVDAEQVSGVYIVR